MTLEEAQKLLAEKPYEFDAAVLTHAIGIPPPPPMTYAESDAADTGIKVSDFTITKGEWKSEVDWRLSKKEKFIHWQPVEEFSENPASDYSVLATVRKWGWKKQLRFRECVELIWHGREDGVMTCGVIHYQPGDFSLAALVVATSEEK